MKKQAADILTCKTSNDIGQRGTRNNSVQTPKPNLFVHAFYVKMQATIELCTYACCSSKKNFMGGLSGAPQIETSRHAKNGIKSAINVKGIPSKWKRANVAA